MASDSLSLLASNSTYSILLRRIGFSLYNSHMPPTLNIWFNRAYATTFWLAKMLKENPDNVPVNIFATHVDPNSPVLQAADFTFEEPVLADDEYILWALDFCIDNSIHVFIPRENTLLIAENVSRFEQFGVKVLVNDPEVIQLFEDKEEAYLRLAADGFPVPPYKVAHGAKDFVAKLDELKKELGESQRIIVKPISGAGASGFRIIKEEPYTMEELLAKPNDDISLSRILEALVSSEEQGIKAPAFMIMPYLDSPEISIDCLSSVQGNTIISIPRTKDASRLTSFSDRFPEAAQIVERLADCYGLKFLTNTQLRWWKGELVILETNTRASGGLYASALTGVNLMWLAIKVLMGEEVKPPKALLGDTYTSVSFSVKMQKTFTSSC